MSRTMVLSNEIAAGVGTSALCGRRPYHLLFRPAVRTSAMFQRYASPASLTFSSCPSYATGRARRSARCRSHGFAHGTSSRSSGPTSSSNQSTESTPPSPGWNTNDYGTGTASSWESYSPSPANADWGDSLNPGDWGEPEFATTGYGSYNNHQQQYQQDAVSTSANGATTAAADNAYAATDGVYNQTAADPARSAYPPPSFNSSSIGNNDYGHQNSWPFADAFGQQQQQQPFSNAGNASMPPPLLPSDITLIGRRDADSMLPVSPSPEQARYYQPRTLSERLVQVVGSFGVSMLLSKSAVLAGPALLYPIWGPWIRAGIRNVQMYLRQFKCVGLWRAEVLGVQINTIPYAYRQVQAGGDTITVTVGDPWQGGARTEVTFPYQAGCEDIVEGEPAELLVLCQDDTFVNFKVVREVYLPQSGMWLSEYPFVDRDVFLDVSLAIERGRQAATTAGPAYGTNFGTAAATGPASYASGAGSSSSYSAYSTSAGPSNFTTGGFGEPVTAAPPGFATGWYSSSFDPGAAAAAAGVHDVMNDSVTAAGAGLGPGAAAEWVVPGSSSSSFGTAAAGAHNGAASPSIEAAAEYVDATAAAAKRAAIFSNVAEADDGLGSGRNTSSYNNQYEAADASNSTGSKVSSGASHGPNGSNSNAYSGSSSNGLPLNIPELQLPGLPIGASGIIDDLSSVATQVSGVASQVTGVATHVASDVASNVAAGVAAGFGWFSDAAGTSSSNGSNTSSDAVVPDVIIDNQGVWSPAAAGYSSAYGSSYNYNSSGSWAQSGGQYGQPYVDQGFTGIYQRDAAGYGSGRYAGSSFYTQPYSSTSTSNNGYSGPTAAAGMGGSTGAGGVCSTFPSPSAATAGFNSSPSGDESVQSSTAAGPVFDSPYQGDQHKSNGTETRAWGQGAHTSKDRAE